MAVPSCPKCGKTAFGMQEILIQTAQFRHLAIICVSCGCVVGVEPVAQTNALIRELAQKLNVQLT